VPPRRAFSFGSRRDLVKQAIRSSDPTSRDKKSLGIESRYRLAIAKAFSASDAILRRPAGLRV
jgi:hypothetical protein